ncbi:MAG: hypothetical protein WCP18_01165 [bacterium]
MSKLSPKDGSNDLVLTLTNGASVKVCHEFEGSEAEGRMTCSDNCPFMGTQEWSAGAMERVVGVWFCALAHNVLPWSECISTNMINQIDKIIPE